MRKAAVIGAVALLLVVVGCSLFSAADYFPLALNDTWTYRMTTTFSMKGTIDTSYTITDSSRTKVLSTATVQGKSGWALESGLTHTDTGYVVEESDKLLSYSSLTDSHPDMILKLPLADNATWVVDSSPYSGRTRATVKGKEAITVPAGSFSDVWKVEFKAESTATTPIYYYFAGNVGLAKFAMSSGDTTATETTSVSMTMELTTYSLK
jgi:hypothetical protein